MDENKIKAQIKKYGKTAYIVEKGTAVQKQFDPVKKELNLLVPGPVPVSIFEKPLSLIGTVSHQRPGEEWPALEGKPCMPILQITTDLPVCQQLFGSEVRLVTVYGPKDAVYLEQEDRWAVYVKEYVESDSLVPVSIPKGTPQEKMVNSIKWKKIIDYPSLDIFPLFYPPELIASIHQLGEMYGPDYYAENFPVSDRIKVGGYPFCLQSEPNRWQAPPSNVEQNVLDWEFMMQISQNEFQTLRLVDQGILTIFRHKHTKEWVGDLQYF